MSDQEIVTQFLNRDEAAIAHTKQAYGKQLLSLSRRIVGNQPDAEECENDTYLAAWNTIPPQKPWDYLFAYLARIIRCLSFDLVKKSNRQKRSAILVELTHEMEECVPARESVTDTVFANELTRMLNEFLRSLNQENRALFLQRYWHCRSIREIAKEFHMKEATVRTRLFRTRCQLRELLDKEEILDGCF